MWPANAWDTVPRKAFEEKSLSTDLLYKYRDWVWPAKGLADIMWLESQEMVKMNVIKAPLTADELKSVFASTAPILKAAYEAEGSYPADSVFADTSKGDLRGVPIWKVDWTNYVR